MHGLAPTTLLRPPTPNRVPDLTPIISKARHSANCRPRNTEQTRSRPALLGNRVVYGKERATYASFPRTPAPFFYADGGASRRHEYKTKKRSGTSSHKGLPTPTGRDRKMAMWFLACITADVASGYPHIRSTITPRLQAHVFVRLLFKYL